MDIEAVLQANKNLSKKIVKLEEENRELWHFRERYHDMEKAVDELKRQLGIKRNVCTVTQQAGGNFIRLQIVRVEDTPEGMFIEVV